MAFSSDAIAKCAFNFFHLLRKEHPTENILFSPLNISVALHLLHGYRGNSAAHTEKVPSFSEKNEPVNPESGQDSEEIASRNPSEASLGMQSVHGEYSTSSEIPEEAIKDAEDNKGDTALHKPVVEEHETKEDPSVPVSLLSSERDARQMDSNLTHALTSTSSQSSSNDESSNILPNKEELEVLSEEQSSPKRKAFHNLTCMPESQDESFAKKNLVAEDGRLPSSSSDETAEKNTYNISLPEFKCTENHVECEEPKAKLETSSLVSLPVSEKDSRQTEPDSHSVQDRASTIPQPDTDNIDSHLLRKEADENVSQEQPSLEEAMHFNQMNPPQSQEGLSQSTSVAVSDASSSSSVSFMDTTTESVLKSPCQEFSDNVKPREGKDSGAEDATSSPLAPTNDGLSCNNLVLTLANASSQRDSEEDISSDFLPWNKDFPGREENETVSQGQPSTEDEVFNDQVNSPKNQAGSFLNNTDTTNPSCFSSVEGTSRMMLNNPPMEKLKCTVNQTEESCEESGGEEGAFNLVSLPNAGQQHSSLTQKVLCNLTFDEIALKIPSSLYCLPWDKYLTGREQRQAVIESRYPLRPNVFENLTAPPESRRYNRHAWMQNLPLDTELN